MIGRIAVFDKVSEDAPSYRPTFKEQIGAELAEIAVFKTTASFELGDTLELQQDVYRHNGSPQHKRDFPAVSGTWSGYDIDKYNGKKVSEAFVYASESFNFKNLNEPWPQVEYDDGTIVVNWIHDGYTNIYHKLDDAIYVGEQPNGLSASEAANIADLIAQKIGQPEKEFIHPFNYAMVYQNEKGDLRTNWVQSKKFEQMNKQLFTLKK